MMTLWKIELKQTFNKRFIIILLLASICSYFIYQFYYKGQIPNFYENLKTEIASDVDNSEARINFLKQLHSKSKNHNKQLLEIIEVWENEHSLSQQMLSYLEANDIKEYEKEIEILYWKRDDNVKNAIKKGIHSDELKLLYHNSEEDFIKRNKEKEIYDKKNVKTYFNKNIPTSSFILLNFSNFDNPLTILCFIILVFSIGSTWSIEFENRNYQLLFTQPFQRESIFKIRFFTRLLSSILIELCIIMLPILLSWMQYGNGFDTYTFIENSTLQINQAIHVIDTLYLVPIYYILILNFIIFLIYSCFVYSIINLLSLILRDVLLSYAMPLLIFSLIYMLRQLPIIDNSMLYFINTQDIWYGKFHISVFEIIIIIMVVITIIYGLGYIYIKKLDMEGI